MLGFRMVGRRPPFRPLFPLHGAAQATGSTIASRPFHSAYHEPGLHDEQGVENTLRTVLSASARRGVPGTARRLRGTTPALRPTWTACSRTASSSARNSSATRGSTTIAGCCGGCPACDPAMSERLVVFMDDPRLLPDSRGARTSCSSRLDSQAASELAGRPGPPIRDVADYVRAALRQLRRAVRPLQSRHARAGQAQGSVAARAGSCSTSSGTTSCST